MKPYRVTASVLVFTALIVLSISFNTEARDLILNQNATPARDVIISTTIATGLDQQDASRLSRKLLVQENTSRPADSSFSASPTSGIAPLVVGINYRGVSSQLKLDFGDGSFSGMNAAPICKTCVPVYTASHIYLAAGTYTARLTADEQIAGMVTISVLSP